MKIMYTFSNGEINEVEVSDEWGEVLVDLDRKEYNNDQKQTRRHVSLSRMSYEGKFFAEEDSELFALFAEEEVEERLHRAIAKLTPKQQEQIKAVYFDGISVNEMAVREEVHQSAISHRLETIYKKLKKFF